MATFIVLAVLPLGTMPVHSCLSAKKASHLNPLSLTNLPGLSVSRSRGEPRGRASYGTSQVLAAAAASEGSEGAQATDAGKKQEKNGVPAKRESSNVQATRGRSRPLVRSLGGLNDLLPPPRSLRQMLDVMGLVFDDPVITPMDVVVNQLRDIIPWEGRGERLSAAG